MSTEAKITLPANMLALTAINKYNTVVDGADFREDGYIYLNGERVDKWFYNFKGHKLWAGLSEKDLPRIEKIYYGAWLRAIRVWNECHTKIVDLLTSTDTPICHIPNENNPNEWRVWHYHPEDNSFSKTWCREGTPTNLEIGREVATIEERIYSVGKYHSLVLDIMNRFIHRILPPPAESTKPLAVVTINGRSYYYTNRNHGRISEWSLLSQPGEVIAVTVRDNC